ncbi:non-hydrolyzing UDP-N-acetylglucosamine 2-epimerase [Spirosoma sp. KNUC1025]|uniref:non-hydrolyzing UDP-N-acetylglucosamine 2-epimerase n=1 Tax=Spirosoma sp. KNUC1025 TaxID=2894082 RepID=UPI003868874F|nr:UDP-N-acetylglucosamine 2-epimerase (non-hydrolyzing) [Spirosoma sp. KNUC1025]
MKILTIVGARPNFIKAAPLHQAFRTDPTIDAKIVHTGQHYDPNLSDIFFRQLNLPQPHYHLNAGTGSQSRQTANILLNFEPVLAAEKPDWVVVIGDVTSTFACAWAASQAGIRVAHVEAGLRSGNRQMPEERNRMHTDLLADLLFVTEQSGVDNLRSEGVADNRIHFVGNVLIDALIQYRQEASMCNLVETTGLEPGEYVLMTMHRPSNVDTRPGLERILQLMEVIACRKTVLFSLHPRTKTTLINNGLLDRLTGIANVRLLDPLGYLEFLNLMEHSAAVVTDSGGVQEETTYLQVPCLTFRNSTERPITVELGTNQLLADLDPATVRQKLDEILNGQFKIGQIPPFWDGHAAERIARIISNYR